MFSLKMFVKKGLLNAVGRMADYQVILNAAGWLEKGVLDEADLAEIDKTVLGNIEFVVAENVDTVIEGALCFEGKEEENFIPVTKYNKTTATISQ